MTSQKAILEINGLKTKFNTERGQVTAVDGVDLQVYEGEVLGIVGESGCGKSATAQSILRLHDEKRVVSYDGEINFDGVNLLSIKESEMQGIRGNEISMIFQDPMSSLNPVFKIGDQITETVLLHRKISRRLAETIARDTLKSTGIPDPESCMQSYPHQLSGGMRQRVLITIALVCGPKVLIADEPTTALDVTTQAQILDIIATMNSEKHMGVLFITHDLGVVAELCSRVAVMYLGQVVEQCTVSELFSRPHHPYTRGLLRSIVSIDNNGGDELFTIEGTVPSLHDVPQGCRFASRCEFADSLCREQMPLLERQADGRLARCWHVDEVLQSEK